MTAMSRAIQACAAAASRRNLSVATSAPAKEAGVRAVAGSRGRDRDREDGRRVQWVFLGCPGVGKGTYGSRLSQLLSVPHIATGDLVRDALASLGPLSKQPEANKMAFSSVFRRVNVKELVSNVSVYTSAAECSGGMSLVFRCWATKKAAGSTKNGRNSNPKYLGVKKFGGEKVEPGNIIVRQRGTRFHPGNYVGMGKDHTIFCLKEGNVRFERNKLTGRKWIHVDSVAGHVLHPIYADGSTTAADMELR